MIGRTGIQTVWISLGDHDNVFIARCRAGRGACHILGNAERRQGKQKPHSLFVLHFIFFLPPRNAVGIACGREIENYGWEVDDLPELDSMRVMLERGKLYWRNHKMQNADDVRRNRYNSVMFGMLQVALSCLCQSAKIFSVCFQVC